MSAEGLAGFGRAVPDDPELLRELLAAPDRGRFVALVVERATALGWDVRPDDVEQGLRASREAWNQRWL